MISDVQLEACSVVLGHNIDDAATLIARELAKANMLKAVELKLRFDGNLKPEDSESLKKIVEDAIKKERWAFA